MSGDIASRESAQILVLTAGEDSSDYQRTLENVGVLANLRTASTANEIQIELARNSYDLLLWRLSTTGDDFSALKEILQRTPAPPPLVIVASRQASKSVQRSLTGLLGHLIRDFLFDDEPDLLGRIVRRILTEGTRSPKMEAISVLTDTPEAFAAFLQACPLATIAMQEDGTVLLWSRAAERLFGWRSEEVVGRPLPTIPPGREEEFRMMLESQMQGVSQEGREVVRWRKDGSLIHVSLWTAPLRDKQGRIRGKLSMLADITEQLKARQERVKLVSDEREAREQARVMDRFRELLEAAPDGIIEVDAEGKIVLANVATERLFGYSRDELLGKSVDDLVPDKLRGQHLRHRLQYATAPLSRPMGSGLPLLARRKDGSQFPVEISLSPVKSTAGFRVSAIIRDVSERKQAEEQLNQIRDKFTTELAAANRELELRNREIERANELKSEFLSSMSHELRTPLHTVVGFSELLAEEWEGPLNAKQKRFIGHIHKDSLHLLELINDILDISKIEAGKLELSLETFDALSALNEVLSSIGSLAEAKSISLDQTSCAPIIISADRVRFKQILYNLLSNAVKFTPAGGLVSIDCIVVDSYAQFSVSDTGVGIPVHEQSAIFEKFHQVGSTTKGVREGTGLGLPIAKYFVEQHGGRIWVESEQGAGSRFYFTLPL
ncbi:MAG TPA: PAS domain S-box protein [Bryobacteraceae bacterium]|nr:PAS domain S-box protein [Bryobacteraceae bacterium]